jgi:hypothetical protein
LQNSAFKTVKLLSNVPGFAQLIAITFLHRDCFLPPRQFVPRSAGWRTSAFFQLYLPGEILGRLSNLYHDRTCTNRNCIMTPKTAPWCLAHRDNIVAKAPESAAGWAAPPTLTCSYPLAVVCNKKTFVHM